MADPIVFGLDPGNSEASGVVAPEGKARILTLPSEIGAGSFTQLTRIRGGAGQQRRLASDEHVLEVDGSSWFVGTLALEQSATASSARGDVARYWSGHTLRLLMVLAETLLAQRSFTLHVVTGLHDRAARPALAVRHPRLSSGRPGARDDGRGGDGDDGGGRGTGGAWKAAFAVRHSTE
jgi:hypothetical protein